jgi:hypothetical protein
MHKLLKTQVKPKLSIRKEITEIKLKLMKHKIREKQYSYLVLMRKTNTI